MPYVVMVDDNFHYMDESERYRAGEYATAEEAIARCRAIVDDYLAEALKIEGNRDATKLYESYVMFGEDPFVVAVDAERVDFSAWGYAKARCVELCGGVPDDRRETNGFPCDEDQDPAA